MSAPPNILQINFSARAGGFHASRVANALVARLLAGQPRAKLVVRDFGYDPHPIRAETALNAVFTPIDRRSPEQAARGAQDDALIAELQASDVLVLAVPMYSFGIPARLKSWVDAISRVDVTFRSTDDGPRGLLTGKKAFVVLASGGIHRNAPSDTITPYLKATLDVIGIADVRFIYAEGLSMGPDASENGLASAHDQIARATAG